MTDSNQQQQQKQPQDQGDPQELSDLYSFLTDEDKARLPKSMLKPGCRRAVLSPYGRDPLVFAALDGSEDSLNRMRSQTIAHEQGKVAEEHAKRTSVQTDALFGIREKREPETPVNKAQLTLVPQPAIVPETPQTVKPEPSTPGSPEQSTNASDGDSNASEVACPATPLKSSSPAPLSPVPATSPAPASAAPEPSVQSDGCVYDEEHKLRFATLDALLERITTQKLADAGFNKDFITTYNLFTSSENLLDMLIARFNANPPEGLSPEALEEFNKNLSASRLRVMIFLKTWVSMLWNSSTPKNLVDKMNRFLEEASKIQKGACETLSKTLNKAITDDESKGPFMFDTKPPRPLLPLNMILGSPAPQVSVLTIHPKEIARQMSLIEQEMFRAVKPWELQNLAFSKKDKSLAPNINTITKYFNEVSQWFACEILSQKDLNDRIHIVERVLDIADYCRQLQNYNALNEIISAMNTSAVFRLKKTWAGLSSRHNALFKELSDLMSNKRNYQNLRHQLHNVTPPLVPYLGVYLTDLTFIEEGNPTMHDDLVNWHKCRLQAKIIIEVQTYQQTPYALQSVPWIRDFLTNIHAPLSPDDQWKISIEVEPRQSATSSTPSKPAETPVSATPTETVSVPVAVPKFDLNAESSGPSSLDSPGEMPATTNGLAVDVALDLSDSVPMSPLPSVLSPVIPGVPTNPDDGSNNAGENAETSLSTSLCGLAASSLPEPEPEPEPTADTPLTIRVFPPGCSQRVSLTVLSSTRVSDVFPRVISEGKKDGMEMTDESETKQFTLISPGSRSVPQGLQFQGMMTVGDAIDSNRGQNTFALFRELALNGVILLQGAESFQVLTYVDADSMLYTNAVIIDNIFGHCGEFSFMMVDGNKQLSWLNYNNTLAEQGFDQNTCFLVIFPLQRFTAHSGSEERERARSKRSIQNVSSPDVKSGFLAVMSTRSVSRPGIIMRFQPQQQSSQSSQLVGSPPPSLSLSSRALLGLSGRGGVSDKERKKFLAVDNFLMCFSDEHAAFPQSVWALDQCDVSLGTLSSGSLCILIRRHPISPFKKSKMTVIAAASDTLTRQWCEALQKKSRYNNDKRIFSKSLTELALRPGATSFVPQFVRDGLELIFQRCLSNPTLFTASVNAQCIDRVRETINRGTMPSLDGHSEEVALAQTILSFYAEMPESLIPGSLFSDLWSYYVDSLKAGAPVVDRLKELLLSLPIPNQVNLKYLLSFFAIWVEDSNSQMRLPELLGSYLIRLRGEDVPVSFKGQTSDVILKIFEDLLALMEDLPFPTDEGFAAFVKKATATAPPDMKIPVTALDKEDIAQLMASVENPHLVLDLNEIAPMPTPTSSHKHTPSSSFGLDGEGEAHSGANSGGSSQRQSDCFEDESDLAEGSVDSPRKDGKHSSTREKASHFFKKFRKSFSTKKKIHMSAGNTPNGSVSFQNSSPDDDSNSSEGCNTPTGSYTPSAPIAVPQSNQQHENNGQAQTGTPASSSDTSETSSLPSPKCGAPQNK